MGWFWKSTGSQNLFPKLTGPQTQTGWRNTTVEYLRNYNKIDFWFGKKDVQLRTKLITINSSKNFTLIKYTNITNQNLSYK